ncbi:dipeptide ABC transporter ATP-binding protein [Candidatus Raskinella chloraquaticus]|jgi:dipeptide transport system ATP-binding protein|uniref:Dipeptide ABC transporter ATP-binding protein n=1 Tax=Candidatus Raskinella chloraquaticus TaxID=1951219 RepID=A0A1W9HRH2_9HYPH|nr:MAG: dipeptide ABC transporter ATP-binding protein [Proteobacteria bacterium SG_bin8]
MSRVLSAENLARHYDVKRGMFGAMALIKALDGVSFTLDAGKTLAIVGESGSGKSTLARLVTMIEEPTSGRLVIGGVDLTNASHDARKALRRDVQIVFQNPYGSLNPRQKIIDALEEPLIVNTNLSSGERRQQALTMLERVGLRPEFAERYPHMFSGGQRQRIAIARALMLRPKILVLDEPVSALDVSIRAQVLNLLAELQDEFKLAYLFISHDLSVVRHIANDVMVIYLGTAVETGSRDQVFGEPRHPYTRALLSATPIAEPGAKRERIILKGELPSPFNPPSGCPFHTRCPIAFERCNMERPPVTSLAGHQVACFAAT